MGEFIKVTENLSLSGQIISSNDVSIYGLISNADIFVKLIMLLLLIASVWSWAIIFNKYLLLKDLNDKSEKFEKLFWSGQLLNQLYERIKGRTNHPLANIFVAAMNEWSRNHNHHQDNYALIASLKERIYKAMDLVINKESMKLESNLSFLALVGSSATFLGILGTVWGVMHSFQSIAASKNTTLAVVAPGIAEALLATAVGLMAAIPAAAFYNLISSKIIKFTALMEDFAIELGALLSRELDDGKK